jgi:hypothetical protein
MPPKGNPPPPLKKKKNPNTIYKKHKKNKFIKKNANKGRKKAHDYAAALVL